MTVEQHQWLRGKEILSPARGFGAGVAAGALMASVLMAGFALSGQGLWTPINAIGAFWGGQTPPSSQFSGITTVAGLATHFLLAGALGALFFSAIERMDKPSLLIIGVWYGFITWFVSTFLVLSWLKPELRDLVRTWPFLIGTLAYGLALGWIAVRNSRPVQRVFSPD
jgi:hypothetical protein